METINRAIEDASAFQEMMRKATDPLVENRTQRRERERREKKETRRTDKKLAEVRS